MTEKSTDIILSGKLSDLPPLPRRSLHLYLCSNKSGMTVFIDICMLRNLDGDVPMAPSYGVNISQFIGFRRVCSSYSERLERYHLWRDALPVLQQHCVQHGLDVVWTDVHYGSNTDHSHDAYRLKSHLDEIRHCHQQSVGPFFVCLIGNKYGDCPLPIYLDEQEFYHIKHEAFESGKDIKLLDDWYPKDCNAVPMVFRLRPIRDVYPNYDFKPRTNSKDHQTDIDDWSRTYTELLDMIQHAAHVAYNDGRINIGHVDKQNRFYTSGLEMEIAHGLKLSSGGCVVLERNIDSINAGVVGATAFIDLEKNIAIDHSKHTKLKQLKDNIKETVMRENHFSFRISWTECKNINRVLEQHGEYIENFIAATTTRLIHLINTTVKVQESFYKENEALCSEVLVHLNNCKTLKIDYSVSGFEKLLLSIQNVLFAGRNSDHRPILIIGQPGCGMSTFISKVCYHARDIFGKETILIVRYIGLTAQSRDGSKLLREICMQLNYVLRQDIDLSSYDHSHLTSYFHGLVNRISKTTKNLVIVFDGIEKIDGNSDDSCDLKWLSRKLPAKVHVIMSCQNLDNESIIIQKLGKKSVSTNSIISFPPWNFQQYSIVFNRKLYKIDRTLNKDQESAILKMLTQGTPKLINTGLQLAEAWTTHFCPNEQNLPSSLTEAIHQQMDFLELIFGEEVIQTVIRYMSLSEIGISEMELLDILSSNRELLKALDIDCRPIWRFPPFLWASIRQNIELLLKRSDSQGKALLTWSHTDIKYILIRRYIYHPTLKAKCHLEFARLFFEGDKNVANDLGSSVMDNLRCVNCPQPLLCSNVKYNMRRIDELWIQLLLAGEYALLKENTFCNFEFLLALIHSTCIDRALNVLQYVLSQIIDPEIAMVYRTLILSRNVLMNNPTQLANELISRLRNYKDLYTYHFESLITQSMAWCDSYNLPLLVPLTSWLQTPRIPLVTSIGGLEGSRYVTAMNDNQHLLCSFGLQNVAMYHIPSKKLVKIFSGHREEINCIKLSSNGTFIVTGSDDGSARIWKITEGLCTNVIKEHKGAVTCLALTPDDEQLITGSYDTSIMIFKASTGKKTFTLKGHDKPITCVTLNTTAKMLLSGSSDRTIVIWCMEEMTKLSHITDYINSPIRCIDLSADGTFLLVGCDDSTLNVISFATGTWIHQLNGHSGWINRVIISEDCNHVIAACQDGSVYVYNLRSKELIDTFRGSGQPVTDIHLSIDETLVFAISEGTANIWNLHKKFTSNASVTVNDVPVTCIHLSDNIAATGSENGAVIVWNLELSEIKDSYTGHTDCISCLQVSFDSSFIVSSSYDKTLCVWDISLAFVITCYGEHTGKVQSLTIFADDSQVISLDCFSNFFIWKPYSGQTLRKYNFPTSLYVLSNNGSTLMATKGDQSVNVWNLSEDTLGTQVNHAEKITCLVCSVDDQLMVTGSSNGSLKVWEVSTGKLTQVLAEYEAEVRCVAITEDIMHIVSGAKDGNIIVWDVQTGHIRHKLNAHNDQITSVKMTTRGQLIISGSLDNTIKVWSMQYGQEITLFDLHCPVINFAMSDDASHIVVQLEKNKYAPLLYLHNSPAVENNPLWSPDEAKILPINLKAVTNPVSLEYPVPKPPTRRRNDSVSSIPQIVKLSPIRAPPSKKKGRRKHGRSIHYQTTVKLGSSPTDHKLSSICEIL